MQHNKAHNPHLEFETPQPTETTNILTVCNDAWCEILFIYSIEVDRIYSCFSKARLYIHHHHHAAGPGRVEYISKGGLRQKLSLSVAIRLSEIPLPQLFKLCKWGGV